MDGAIEVLNGASGVWADAMWAALWQSTVLAGAVLLAGKSVKRMTPAIRYWLWMFVGLRLLVMPFVTMELALLPAPPPVLEVSTSIFVPPPRYHTAAANFESAAPAQMSGETASTLYNTSAPAPNLAKPVVVRSQVALSGRAALMLLWCGGCAVALTCLGRACMKTRRIIAASRFGDQRIEELTMRAGAYFGMTAPPCVGITRESVSPFVYGAWKPVVILPADLVAQASDEQLMVVLAHEFAHVRRRDPLFGWVFAFCHALYFFHPVLPLVKRQLLLERERACDDWVLAVSNARPSTYARVLVEVAALCGAPRHVMPALVAGETFHDLKTRLNGLRYSSVRRAHITPLSALTLLLVGLLCAPGIVLSQQAAESLDVAPAVAINAAETPAEAPAANGDPVTVKPAVAPAHNVAASAPLPSMRTLRFPSDRVVGMLHLKDRNIEHYIDRYWYWNDDVEWIPSGPAVGTISVPDSKLVYLVLNQEGGRDTSFLKNLDPDDIYRLASPYGEGGAANLDDRGLENIVALRGLRHLELGYSQVTDAGLALLQKLPHLERLSAPRSTTDAGVAHIAKVATLQGLYFKENQVTNAGLAQLANLQDLRELELGGGAISDAGLEHLASLPKLDYLMLWGYNFSDGAMEHIAQIPNLTNLNVSNLKLTNRGVQSIAQSPTLETLDLYGVKDITGAALKYIAVMKTLQRLNLSSPPGEESRINSHSMSYLAESTSLEALDAPRSIDDSGLIHLAKLRSLKELNTWGGSGDLNITDKGLLAVASHTSLQKLSIVGFGITDTGLTAIGGLRDLDYLSLLTGSKSITNIGVGELANLKNLNELSLNLNPKSGVTLAALTRLNSLTALTDLTVYGINQDDSVLDLSPMVALEKVSLDIEGGLRDQDVACFSGMTKLRWLQGLSGIGDGGAAHLAGLTGLVRLGLQGETLSDAALALLKGMHYLDTLTVSGDFTDTGLQELRALKGLHWLTVQSDPPLSQGAQERLVAALPNLTVYNQSPLAGR